MAKERSSAAGFFKEAKRINKRLNTAEKKAEKRLGLKRAEALVAFGVALLSRLDREELLLLPYTLELKQTGKKPTIFILARERITNTGGTLEDSKIVAIGLKGEIDSGISIQYQTESGGRAQPNLLEFFQVTLADQSGATFTEKLLIGNNERRNHVVSTAISYERRKLGTITIKGIQKPGLDLNLSYVEANKRLGRLLVPTPKA